MHYNMHYGNIAQFSFRNEIFPIISAIFGIPISHRKETILFEVYLCIFKNSTVINLLWKNITMECWIVMIYMYNQLLAILLIITFVTN